MRRALAFVGAGALAVAVLAALGWPAERYLHVDFISYYLGGRALLEGRDPYDPATWRALHDEVGSLGYDEVYYSPLTTAIATLPFALLPFAFAAPAWFVLQTALATATLILLGRRLFAARPRRDLVLLLALAAVVHPAYVLAGGGNIARHMLPVAAGSLVLLLHAAPFAAGLVLGLCVLKPQSFVFFVPALLLALGARERARAAAGFALVVAVLLATSLALRTDWIPVWVERVLRLKGVGVGVDVWGIFPADVGWASLPAALASVAAFVAWRRLAGPDLARYAAAALALSLWLAPHSAPYDDALLLVAIAAVLASIETLGPLPRAAFIAAIVLLLGAPLWLSAAGLVPADAMLPLLALPRIAAFALLVAADAAGRAVARQWIAEAPLVAHR